MEQNKNTISEDLLGKRGKCLHNRLSQRYMLEMLNNK